MTVTVTDASGATIVTGSTTVVVSPPPPHIGLAYSPGIPTATLPTTFHLSIPSGQAPPASVTWSFGDGTTTHGTTQSTSHTYATSGTYTATVTETDTSGETLSSSQTLDVAPDSPQPADANASTVVANPPGALTQGPPTTVTKSTVRVTLYDAWHRIVRNATVTLHAGSTTARIIGPANPKTDSNGVASFVVKDSNAETVVFSARDTTDGVSIAQTASVIFGPPAAHATIDLSATSEPANGTSPVTVTVTLTDAHGAPAPAKQVRLAEAEVTPGKPVQTPVGVGTPVVTNANGVATFEIAERRQITLQLAAVDRTDGVTFSTHPPARVTFTAAPGGPADAATSTIAVDTQSVPDDGTSKTTITVTLLNASGGAVPGRQVTLHTTSGLVRPSAKAATTDANGVATFTATATSPVTATFTADDAADSLTVGPSPAVSFYAHVPDASTSSIAASPVALPDDGTSSSLVTVTLRDRGGAAVTGDLVLLQATGNATVTAVSSLANAQGVATFRVADATAETVTLSARVLAAGVTFGATTIEFGDHVPSDARSSVTATPSNVVDDGHTAATVTVKLVDHKGIPVSGDQVSLVADGGHSHPQGLGNSGTSLVFSNGPSSQTGVVKFSLVDSHDETVTYTAIDDTTGMTLSKTATVSFSPRADANASSISASPVAVPAGGSTTVTVALRTSGGDPVSGRKVKLMGATVSGGKAQPASIIGQTTTDASGDATFTLRRATQIQIALTADAVDDGITITSHPSLVVSFAAPTGGAPSGVTSTVSAAPTSVRAGGGRTATVTVTLRNVHGGAVSGKAVSLHGTGHSTISPASAPTDASGVATFTVTDATVETATYTAVDTDDSLTLAATASVDFYGHEPDPQASSITATPGKVADDGATRATVRVTLEDTGGVPVSGKHVTVHASGTAVVSPGGATTNASGIAVFHVTDTRAEMVTLTASDPADHVTLASPAYVKFVALPSATLSTLEVDQTNVASNGKVFATVTATLRDAQGHAISNTLVELQPLSGSSIVKRKLDTATGPAGTPPSGGVGAASGTPTNSFLVADQTAETVTYEAIDTTDGITLAQTVTVAFSPPAAPGHTFISISPTSIPADTTTTATITVTLETASGAPAVGKAIQLNRTGTAAVKIDGGSGGTTDSSGTVTFTVTGYLAGTVTFSAKDVSDSWTDGKTSHQVETPSVQLTVG